MSCPAIEAYGPSWPHPVMRPYTSPGLRARHSSGPMPKRSATPGRNPSISPSAPSTSFSTVATPSGCLRSTPTLRRPRLSTSKWGVSGISSRTRSARSTRTTSAPRSASIMAANGPGPIPAISTTRMPLSGPMLPPELSTARTVPAFCLPSLIRPSPTRRGGRLRCRSGGPLRG